MLVASPLCPDDYRTARAWTSSRDLSRKKDRTGIDLDPLNFARMRKHFQPAPISSPHDQSVDSDNRTATPSRDDVDFVIAWPFLNNPHARHAIK
jgi:hypothetical protein